MLVPFLTGIVLLVTCGCAEEVNLSCSRIPSAVKECPSQPGSEQACNANGCYYCEGLIPTCVQGAGCSHLVMSASKECKQNGRRIFSKSQCYAQGCSWCQDRTGVRCYINPTSPTEMEASPICGGKSSAEFDCRNDPAESLTPIECVKRKGCSWCSENAAFQCVKDPSVAPTQPTCTGSETLNCFPYPTISVTKEKCDNEIGCAYCANAAEDKRCMRSECPSGWTLRKDGKSCCQTPLASSNPISRSMSWLVEYRAGNTICEGFVVSPTLVITSGQCRTTSNGVVIPGSIYVDSDDVSAATVIAVLEVIRFPYFLNLIPCHDIMLLKLPSDVPDAVQPLSLPFGEIPPVGMTCYVGTFEGNSLVDYETNIVSDSECSLKDEFYDEAYQFCAQLSGSNSNSCAGKVGSPIVCQRCSSCEWYAYGITSYTLDCSVPYPTYYTKLSAYREFLEAHGVSMLDENYTCDMQ